MSNAISWAETKNSISAVTGRWVKPFESGGGCIGFVSSWIQLRLELNYQKGDRSVLKPLFEEDHSSCEDHSTTSDSNFPPQQPLQQQQQQQSPVSFPGPLSPYVIPAASPVDGDLCLPEIPRHKIHLIEKIGEGNFGTVSRFRFVVHSFETRCKPIERSQGHSKCSISSPIGQKVVKQTLIDSWHDDQSTDIQLKSTKLNLTEIWINSVDPFRWIFWIIWVKVIQSVLSPRLLVRKWWNHHWSIAEMMTYRLTWNQIHQTKIDWDTN